jgi:hypothetical protein
MWNTLASQGGMMNDQFDERKLNQEYPHTYLHILGGCHGIAFMSKIKIEKWYEFGDVFNSVDFINENGEHPVPGSQVVCGHCGQPMEFPPQLLDKKLLTIIRIQRKMTENDHVKQ